MRVLLQCGIIRRLWQEQDLWRSTAKHGKQEVTSLGAHCGLTLMEERQLVCNKPKMLLL